jgi:hypothetical protein
LKKLYNRTILLPPVYSNKNLRIPSKSLSLLLSLLPFPHCTNTHVTVQYNPNAMSLRPNARVEVRRNRYKVAVDADEGRRRREDNMVEIRKSKREESLLKKRRGGLQAQQLQQQQEVISSLNISSASDKPVLSLSLSLDLIIGGSVNYLEISMFEWR